ncbi:Rdx domain-containing protein [Cephalotus follicularis]|uniref:Rdx domain-containing protein n=1 Tax=Cephalotus follicularis TaxID=3775 RepID=A0A1Q3BF21_CEPFO|nr:Rdx domain-containing protein [Cephalotus follicularis]
MDRVQLLLVGIPLFLVCSDLINLFAPPPPPKPRPSHHHHHHPHNPPIAPETLEFPLQKPAAGRGIGYGSTININFCASCSYRGTAVTMKKMLEATFPGIDVVLANYPPALPKRILAKVVPAVQMGVIGIIMAGEQIFPMVGIVNPPQWYYSLRANRFGSMASTWLLGNFLQSFLQSSGAFEVYCNDELVYSKLKEGRFPGEIELKDLIGKKLSRSVVVDGLGDMWS